MGGTGTLADDAAIKPISAEELAPLWGAWRGAGAVLCPRDLGPMALAVDGVSHGYRLVCVRCGAASPWFEASPSGPLQLRSGTSSMPAPRAAGD